MKVPSIVNPVIGVGIAAAFKLMRMTFRVRVRNDQRERLMRRTGKSHALAILHAHQLAALSLSAPRAGAMVSRSRDGDLLLPLLRASNCVPIRGSSGAGQKGGATALTTLIRHVKKGHPGVIAVDGPRGPRGAVQKGIAMLAMKADVPIIPVVLIPRRRWIFQKAWDRMQILLPFTLVDAMFGDPIFAGPDASIEELTAQVEASLKAMELQMDPEEARKGEQMNQERAARRKSKTRSGSANHQEKPASFSAENVVKEAA
ncbi:lysophospholipid acyltransferase family protein [Rhodopirellula halodulae]|uniref:lysophospholipid acyltransferase family protein n=1 Tax=Rhodopirellula halodulae TaxID=2894198 RepID=UPI001E44E9A8|nr:lysophospholipid acyltransferase family protein [Rhodopirellula sp. JC737]MCC9657460.1 lysophospholipid acyltransferase family protein [Rhodopirellula sp. JC737]